MKRVLNQLKPEVVWNYFEDICQIPRPSKKEEKIRDFLLDFAKKHQLQAKRDEIGNVLICKPATAGMEDRKTVILQSHMDMVCEKNADTVHDFDHDPIQPWIDGEWVKAKGTTLGADDGIGVAAQMALLSEKDIAHGPIECLFTVDEETGLSGAFALQPGFMDGKILLNLDSEDEGELFIGCAGGIDTLITIDYQQDNLPEGYSAYKLKVSGLRGGHSGDEIHKGLGNSNKILNRFLWNQTQKTDLRIGLFEGGNLRNAIAREAFAHICIPQSATTDFEQDFVQFTKDVQFELEKTEPDFKFEIEKAELPEWVIDKKTQFALLNALYACPHGVYAMSQKMPGMVETSTNLAAIKFIENNQILVTTSQRSDLNSAKLDIAAMVKSAFLLAGAKVVHSDGYPGWAPNPNSEIVQVTVDSYKRLFNTEPVVRSIHAGLECGLFLEKYPYMDMISFGPTILNAHSPGERINIKTMQKFWDLTLDVLKNIPKE